MTGVTEPTDPEDRKIITLARAARARTQAAEGAAVRDTDGRTYAATSVGLPTLQLSAVQVAVAMAVSSGAPGLEAVAVVGPETLAETDLAAIADLGGSAVVVWLTDGSGAVTRSGRVVTEQMSSSPPAGFRSGFACFVGRPNAGKSTLTNALVGSKIAIASSKPQTTRHAIRGIVHRPDAQLVLIDTPGLHKPRTLLGERLNDLVRATWTEVDVVGVCLPANEKIGPGDTYLVGEIAALPKRPELVAIATKSDLVKPERMAQHLLAIQGLEETLGIAWSSIVPVSAVAGDQLDVLADELVSPAARGPDALPGRRDHRRAGGDPGRRADPRGRARGGPRRAAPLDHRRRSRRWACARAGRRTSRCSTCSPR